MNIEQTSPAGKIKAVIFDMDGTLACTMWDIHYSLCEMLAQCGLPSLTVEEMMRSISFREREFVRRSVAYAAEKSGREAVVDDEENARCLKIFAEIYDHHYCDRTCIYDGLEEVVRKMKASGIRLAIHTNKKIDQATGIAEKLMPGVFEIILGEGSCIAKPDPDGACRIAAQFGARLEEVLFIGDSDLDMKTAVNAKMMPVGVAWGYGGEAVLRESGAACIVLHPDELLTLCGLG